MALPAPGPGCGTKPEITLPPATALRAGSRLGAPCPSAPTATPRAWGVRPDSSRSSGSAAVSPVPSPVGCRSRRLAIFLTCFPCMVVCHVRVAPCVKSCTRPPPPKMNRSAWDLGLGTDRPDCTLRPPAAGLARPRSCHCLGPVSRPRSGLGTAPTLGLLARDKGLVLRPGRGAGARDGTARMVQCHSRQASPAPSPGPGRSEVMACVPVP